MAVGHRNCTALIQGASGTGKELVARHIHATSTRAQRNFVAVDCTTLQDTLLESQLFGHKRGAFTGAEESTLGLIRAANAGTLFLDEIGELTLTMQAKLLRCIQERAVVPVGAVAPVPVDTRMLAATNRDLAAMVRRGQFREDLYFRLDVVRVIVPPLRKRPADILPLAEHFLAFFADLYGEPCKRLAPVVAAAFQAYGWPGNIRELRNAIEHSLVLSSSSEIELADLPPALQCAARRACHPAGRRVIPLRDIERIMLRRALRAAQGNKTLAAEMLGVERHRLTRMIARHGLRRSRIS
jgi:transcriptional regulator with PAS, ATPase and Fis domain